jgi:hypothetical protein
MNPIRNFSQVTQFCWRKRAAVFLTNKFDIPRQNRLRKLSKLALVASTISTLCACTVFDKPRPLLLR